MTIRPHWYLPTSGDGRDIVGWVHARTATATPRDPGRPPDIDYLAEVARAADRLGFESVLTPVGTWCEDPWITTAALLRETRRLQFIVALRPDSASPTLIAQMAATYQQVSSGRLHLNIVIGSDEEEQRRFGDRLQHDARYTRAGEFLQILRGAWSGEPYDLSGEHFQVDGATVGRPPETQPRIFLGGASGAAVTVAAEHADVYLLWGEPPDAVAGRVQEMRRRAADSGRTIEFGIRLHVITRDTAREAWAQADRLLAAADPHAIAVAQERFRQSTSIGQRRMSALHGGSSDALVVSPNLWAGFGLLRRHAGTALVGSHDEVAERLAEYHEIGIEHVILSGQPHLEEAYTVAEGLFPALRRRDLLMTTR